jgi:glycyl-tRNA synthetase
MNKEVSLETIVSLCKRRGFIYQGSEIYGGLAGTWDYGPLGVALKRNITNLWWKTFVEDRDDMLGVDAAILMNQKVWQASGHVDTFTDPLVECSNCHARLRADKLDDPNKCPVCGKEGTFGEPRQFNMMFETSAGPAVTLSGDEIARVTNAIGPQLDKIAANIDSDQTADALNTYVDTANSVKDYFEARLQSRVFLRPETAQGIFTNYKNVVDSFYPDVPFGIAQQGKAFRNEISPRDFVFRSREFEQMEIEYFIHPDKWEEAFEQWVKDIEKFLQALGLPKDKIHQLEVPDSDRAHYSKRTIDFEYDFPIGKEELLGLAYRTDFDLTNIQKASGKSMEYRPKDGGKPFVPHVIEPSFGVERAIMAVLSAAYTEDEVNGEKRAYLKLPAHLAPVKVAVSPLLKNKPELVAKAQEVYKMLKKEFGAVMWDDNGNIGKRYRRQDEIGTPYCVTIDFDTLNDDSVTVRSRDTTEQKRINIAEIQSLLTI